MKKHARIQMNRAVRDGKPVIRGTDVLVEQILREMGAGASDAQLLQRFQRLELEDVQAAHAFAADYVADWIGSVDWVEP